MGGRSSKVRIPPKHEDPTSWFRVHEVAKILAIHPDAVREKAKSGALHPVIIDAERRFDPTEVYAYAATHPTKRPRNEGDIAARACKMFDEQKPRRQIVRVLRITFDEVDRLYAEWLRGDDCAAVESRRRQEAEREAAEREAREQRRLRDARHQRLTDAIAALGAAKR